MRDCKHGSLARSCEVCELQREVVENAHGWALAEVERAAGELVMSDEDRLLDIFLRARPGHDPPKGEFFSYFTVCILHENIREFSAIVDRLRSAKSAAAGKGE